MDTFGIALTIAAVSAAAGALALGLINLARKGSPAASQRLMRWRIALQFLAILAVAAAALHLWK